MPVIMYLLYLLLPGYIFGATETGLSFNDPTPEDFPFPILRPWIGMVLSNTSRNSFISERCRNDSNLLRMAFQDKLLWATRMVDASVGEVTGALWGSRIQLGSFDGCLSAGAASPVGARYCLLHLELHPDGPPLDSARVARAARARTPWSTPEQLEPAASAEAAIKGEGLKKGYYAPGDVLVAQCVPRSCVAVVLEAAARTALAASPARPSVSVLPQYCTASGDGDDDDPIGESQDDASPTRPYLPPRYAGWICWCLLLMLSGACVAAPYFGWSSWDWRRNLVSLRQPDAALEGMDLSPLSGMRTITAVVIVSVHHGVASGNGAYSNLPTSDLLQTHPLVSLLLRVGLLVDTFFFLSGILFVLCKSRHGFVKSLITRFFRLVPVYVVMILVTTFALPTLATGPLWKDIMGAESRTCARWWWANLLFIHNYLGLRSEPYLCVPQSWSVSAEMQLFVLSALLRPQQRGCFFLLAALLLSVAAPFAFTLLFHYPVAPVNGPKLVENYFEDPALVSAYIPTHMHASSYVMGLFVGMLLLRMRKQSFHLSGGLTWLLTAGSLTALLANLLSSVIMMDPGRPYSAIEAALYVSLTPVAWTASLGALIIAMVFGEPTSVRSFLSWQPLVSLSRLTYAVYLIGLMYQYATVAYLRDAKMISPVVTILESMSDMAVCFFLSFIMFLILEAPLRKVVKNFLERRSV